MALTRAQLLSGNQGDGVVLPNQPQGVIAGAGISISNTGIISVNASTTTGLVKLNDPFAYNSYVWPGADGTAGEFLQTDGAGNLGWATPQGFAVVTVSPQPAPSPADVGELWFDCSTGTLNVYQNCVGTPSPNWFNVAQPGFPVLPGNTGAVPGFAGGTGVQADPYDCTVTSVGSGNTVQIIQTVTVTGLAAFQYVPIVDLNAVANGGRFSFTNNYADSNGDLTFDILFTDNPPSPAGTPYTAAIKVGYGSAYIEARVNVVAVLTVTGGTISGPRYVGQQLTYTPGVPSGGSTPYGTPAYQWYADGLPIGSATGLTFTLTGAQLGKQITASTTYTDASSQTATGTSAAVGPVLANPGTLTITSPGSISPSTNVSVGTTLNYTAGTFTGGIPTVTPSWKWQRNGTDILGVPANATSYPTVTADANQAITVLFSVTDSATPTPATASQSTAAVTPFNPIPSLVWNPSPNLNSNAESVSSGAWNGTVPQTITASGCVEVSLNGTSFSNSVNVTTAGATLYQRWKPSCVAQKSGDTITGSVDAGAQGRNDYSIQLDHIPSNVYNNITSSNVVPGATAFQTTGVALSGVNAPAYVTIASSGNTGTNIQAATSAAGPWTTLAATGTGFQLLTGQTLFIRQTVGSSPSTGYVANIQVGDDPAVSGATFSTFTYTATTSSGILPAVWSPTPDLNTDAEAISSGLWNGTFPQVITATGCVEVSLDGSSFSNSVTVGGNVTLYQRWKPSCVGQKSGDTITGSVDAGSQGKNDYSIQLDHLPSNAYNNLTASGIALGADVVGTATSVLAGVNAPAYVTIASSGNTGTNIQASTVSATGPWTTLATTGTTFPLLTGQNLYIKQTVGGSTSTPYVANIQVGDDPAVVGATFSSFSFTATTTGSAAFPGLTFTPTSGPNAAPDTVVNVTGGGSLGTLEGVANSNSWPAGLGTSLSSPVSGANPTMKFRVNGSGSYVSSALNVVPTDVLNLAWNEAYLATVADGTNATGTITGTVSGTTYTNTFTLGVKRSAVWSVPTPPVTGVPLSSTQTTGSRVVNDFNVPVTVTFAAPTTGTPAPQPMTDVSVSIGGQTAVPVTLGTTTVTINPGQSIQVYGKVGSANNQPYGVKVQIGTSAAQDWLVTTTAVTPTIQTPVIGPPSDGAVNVGTLSGLTVSASSYVPLNNPGTHASSDWQVVGNLGSTTKNPETSAIVSVATNTPVWTTQSAGGGSTDTFYGAAYGNGTFVVVGNGYRRSPDGVTWSSTTGLSGTKTFAAFGNNTFLTGGAFGGMNTSTDNGANWSSITAPGSGMFAYDDAAYGGTGRWVVVGSDTSSNPYLAYADTLGSWTVLNSGIGAAGAALQGVAYGNGLWVAVGVSGNLITSPNGSSWTPRTSGFGSNQIRSVAYGNGVWVAVGNGVSTSTDGINWNYNSGLNAARVSYANGLFVTVGSTTGNGQIYVSTDGINWTLSDSLTGTLYAVAGGGGQWVTAGGVNNSFIATSTAPAGTTVLTLTDNTNLASMQVGDTVVEVGGGADATGTITAITPATPSITVTPSSTAWTGGSVATAKDTSRTITVPNQPLISTNQITAVGTATDGWTAVAAGQITSEGFTKGQSLLVGAGNNAVTFSADGVNWSTAAVTNFSQSVIRATEGGGTLVALGANLISVYGIVSSTNNGASWTNRTSGLTTSYSLSSIIYANNLFVVTAYGPSSSGSTKITTSPDGVTWTPRSLPAGTNLSGIAYGNGIFMAVGSPDSGGGSIQAFTSTNGTSWVQTAALPFGFNGSYPYVAYGNGRFMIVGASTSPYAVFTSDNGATWTTIAGGGTSLSTVAYNNGIWMTRNSSGTGAGIYTITDATLSGTAPYSFTTEPVTTFNASGFAAAAFGTFWMGSNTNNVYKNATGSGLLPLTISGANTDGFAVGNLISNGVTGASAASGTITAINATTVTVAPSSANWANGQNLYRGETIVNVTNDGSNLVSYPIPKPPLTANTTYFARVKYNSQNNPPVYSSNWSAWSKFTTGGLGPAGTMTLLATVNAGSRGAVQWDGSTYVLGASDLSTPSTATAYYSTNLTSWSPSSSMSASGSQPPLILWTGSKFLGFGSGVFSASTPAGPWTIGTPSFAGTAPSGWQSTNLSIYTQRSTTQFFASSGNTAGVSSDAGVNWTTYGVGDAAGTGFIGAFRSPLGVGTFFNGKYIQGVNDQSSGGATYLATSTTGASGSWTAVAGGPSGTWPSQGFVCSAASPTSAIVCQTGVGIWRTTDASAFTQVSTATATLLWAAYGAGIYVAVGNAGAVYTSTDDGLTWSNKTPAGFGSVNFVGVNYVNGKWLVNTNDGKVYQLT